MSCPDIAVYTLLYTMYKLKQVLWVAVEWLVFGIDICKSIHLVVESNYNVENVWKFIPIERKILHEFHG